MSAPPLDNEPSQSSSGYEDGLGRRQLSFDRESGGMLERLVLRPELGAFERALARRLRVVAALENEWFARPRAIARDADGRLVVTSEYPSGRRLSEIGESAAEHGIVAGLDAGLGLLLELIPAVARLHEEGFVHGALAAGRVMITGAGRVVLLDSIYGEALEQLQFTRNRLWTELQLAFPPEAGRPRFDRSADLGQASMMAAALILGHALEGRSCPDGITTVRKEILEISSIRGSTAFALAVDRFFVSTLPLAGRRQTSSGDEAAIELRKMLRKELGIHSCRTALLEFLQQVNAADADRAAAERADAERSARDQAERLARQHAALRLESERGERLEAERIERERVEAAQRERERLEAERAEQARLEAERIERQRVEAAQRERERLEAERAEQTRLEAERIERERLEAAQRERERLEAERAEQARLEAERIERERLEAAQRERERLEAERAEQARLEAERIERERVEAAQRERERLEAKRIERERLEAERREHERLKAERKEQARLEAERARRERAEAKQRERERLEAERADRARLEAERIERERAEAEQRERERVEAEHKARVEAERRERERLETERAEQARLEAERIERERLKAEQRERDRVEAERKAQVEAERRERERLEAERAEQARLETKRIERERVEAEHQRERDRVEAERKARLEAERRERERLAAERAEQARVEAERIERERLEALQRERDRVEAERKARLEAERRERERLEAERAEQARLEAERIERERLEAEWRERERLEAERAEQARLEAERIERDRLEAEWRERERLEAARAEQARIERERIEQERRESLDANRQEHDGALAFPQLAAQAPVARPYPVYIPPAEPAAWTADLPPSDSAAEPLIAPIASAPDRIPAARPVMPAPIGLAKPPEIRFKPDAPYSRESRAPRADRDQSAGRDLTAADGYEPFRTSTQQTRAIPWKLVAGGAALLLAGGVAITVYVPTASPVTQGVRKVVPAPATGPATAAVAETVGRLAITTQPAAARITVDGKPAGESPLTLEGLKPGRHVVVLSSGEGTVKRTVRIEAGQTLALDVPLFSGFVAIALPFVVDVAEKGKALGTSENQILLSAGRHELRLSNNALGYTAMQGVEIQPGEVARLQLDPKGRANINAAPWAEIWIDGEKAGETPLANVPVRLGVREIVFKNPQFPDRRQTVTITATSAATVSVDFAK